MHVMGVSPWMHLSHYDTTCHACCHLSSVAFTLWHHLPCTLPPQLPPLHTCLPLTSHCYVQPASLHKYLFNFKLIISYFFNVSDDVDALPSLLNSYFYILISPSNNITKEKKLIIRKHVFNNKMKEKS